VTGGLQRLLSGLRETVRLRRDDDRGLRDRFPPPGTPWAERYVAAHRTFVGAMLDDDRMVARFATGEQLPPDYGLGLDERVVEYPWVFAQQLFGRVLDAGSTFNHAHILDRLLPSLDALHIVTLAPEEIAFTERGVSYLFADLRELPLRDGLYDAVVSISTLEHVGMDNSSYGAAPGRSNDPDLELRRALGELRRVACPGGRLLVTVPYGRPDDHGWLRQFDAAAIAGLVKDLGTANAAVRVYAYEPSGWQLSSLDDAAEMSYYAEPAAPPPAPDGAVAARAVACIAASF
jgi:SAM-dependent methyltransferase